MKTVLITGSSSGIGAATARKFAAEGWRVAATMRSTTNRSLFSDAPDIHVIALDVAEPASVKLGISTALAALGHIDVVVNNAGYGLFGPFETTSSEAIQAQFRTNVFGVFDVIREVLPTMRARQSGLIINIASSVAAFPMPPYAVYSATKAAITAFGESLAYELAPLGIGVKTVLPGAVATKFSAALDKSVVDDGGAYAPMIAKITAGIAANRSRQGATAEALADAIFGAATDGLPRQRYAVGDDMAEMAAFRAKAGDDGFMTGLRERFGF